MKDSKGTARSVSPSPCLTCSIPANREPGPCNFSGAGSTSPPKNDNRTRFAARRSFPVQQRNVRCSVRRPRCACTWSGRDRAGDEGYPKDPYRHHIGPGRICPSGRILLPDRPLRQVSHVSFGVLHVLIFQKSVKYGPFTDYRLFPARLRVSSGSFGRTFPETGNYQGITENHCSLCGRSVHPQAPASLVL